MAGMEAKIAALLSLLAVILLAHTLLPQPPRLRDLLADRLLPATTLQFDGHRLVKLVHRRNMILLCHVILLLILKDAGLLGARRELPLTGAAVHLAEQHSSDYCFNFDHAAGEEITVAEDKRSCFQFEQIADDDGERSRGEEEMAPWQETEAECVVDDVDEMNRRFEEFIAGMRRKMQLESLQLVKV